MDDRLIGFSINKNGYGTIPKSVMQDTELSISAKAVYSYFCSFTGSGDTCFPSRKKICFDLGIANNSLSKYLNELINNGYLQVEQVKEKGRFSHNVYTLPDIKLPCTKICDTVNWGYGDLHTKNNSSKTNNTSKKNNTNMVESLLEKVGYDFKYAETSDLHVAVNSFIEFRKSIKKPMTEYAVQLMIRKLYEMTKDPVEAKQIIQQSIMNGWQGIFPLKENNSAKYGKGRKEAVPGWMKRELDDDERRAIQRMLNEDNTIGNNPELADRAERLRLELQGE